MKPVIGIFCTREDPDTHEATVSPGFFQLAHENGCELKVLDWHKLHVSELVSIAKELDACIFSGGGDVDPGVYGADKRPGCGLISPRRDAIELATLPLMDEAKKPILGICRGHQVLNVAYGGTLIQDLPSQKGVVHRQSDSCGPYYHELTILEGTRLNALIGGRVLTNSFHHQAVDTPAPGFIVNAVSDDGIIEGIETAAPGRFILGVQWHPESVPDDPVSKRIFAAFAAAIMNK